MRVTTFSWLDYFFFISMLASSALVGVYYGFFQKQDTVHDYLLGGKRMSAWPIALSVVSSVLSGFTLLSVPADIYKYGVTYGLVIATHILVGLASYFLFLPVFYKLQITSIYEYLAIRFNNKVRIFGSLMYAIYMVLYLPIVIYIPALALGQVTNLNIHLITPIVCGVCIFYTTLGGLKAVVWTDVIQFGVMLGSMLTVIIVGIQRGGGFMNIVRNSYHGGRLNISYELDFLQRDSFWAVFFGQAVQITSHFSVGQSTVQKFMSLSAFKLIKITLVWAIIGMSVIVFLSILSGLLMYSNYMNCDPVGANLIKTNDQILPFYVMEQASFIPGLCGLFISGIFSAGLSTLSAIMNCLSATLYEDFISPFVPKNTSQKRISQYLKLIVVAIGITSTALVYVVEKLGSLAALTLSFTGITSGPILGLFCVGMVLPQVTAKGALSGGIVSLCIMAWVILTAQWYKTKGIISYPSLPVSTSGCNKTIINTSINNMFINTTNLPTILDDEEPFAIYRVSFYWYAAMGLVINVIVSLAVSCFTKEDKPLKRNCISPIMQFLIVENGNEPPQYDEVAELVNLKK